MHTWQVEEETNNDKQLYCTILAEAEKSYCIEALNIFICQEKLLIGIIVMYI